jgi:hypothetical protein
MLGGCPKQMGTVWVGCDISDLSLVAMVDVSDNRNGYHIDNQNRLSIPCNHSDPREPKNRKTVDAFGKPIGKLVNNRTNTRDIFCWKLMSITFPCGLVRDNILFDPIHRTQLDRTERIEIGLAWLGWQIDWLA